MSAEDEPQYDNATVALQIQQFLDEWHYRIIANLAGNVSWDRPKATIAALEIFELQGVTFEPGEKEALAAHDETSLIQALLQKMSDEFKIGFENFALQLHHIVATTTQVRKVVDDGNATEVAQVMDSTDSTGITSKILKSAIVQAGVEVAAIRNRHTSWTKNTDTRVSRLVRAGEDAAACQRQLAALQQQIGGFGQAQNEKSKKMMAGVASNNDKALVSMVFGGWLAFTKKMISEKDIRDAFEAEIANLDTKLFEYRQHQLNNVRNVLMRKAAEGDGALMIQVWKSWADEVQETKREAGSQDAMKAMEAKLAGASAAQTENTKKVMSRMAAGSDNALLSVVLTSWVHWLADYKKNKDMEDEVKAQEAKMQEYLKQKKEGAKAVLDKMNSATDSGLVEHVISTWAQHYADQKEAHKMELIMAENEAKFASLNGRQKDNAKGVMGRVNEETQLNCLLRHFLMWATDTKVERVMKYYNSKMDSKKHQLQSVQSLFKNFATQLDQGLKGEADSARDSRRKNRDDGFLPDINAKR
jgi:hypothetical protein